MRMVSESPTVETGFIAVRDQGFQCSQQSPSCVIDTGGVDEEQSKAKTCDATQRKWNAFRSSEALNLNSIRGLVRT